jgi:hypothetical protein
MTAGIQRDHDHEGSPLGGGDLREAGDAVEHARAAKNLPLRRPLVGHEPADGRLGASGASQGHKGDTGRQPDEERQHERRPPPDS